jgi:hypothetical protein
MGLIWSLAWRIGAFWLTGLVDPVPPLDEASDGRHPWRSFKTRSETVSWPVAKSRLVSSVPLAQTRVSQSEAALPALMGVRGITPKMATMALEKARAPGARVRLEVPLARNGGMMQLHLEVSSEQRDTVMRLLSGAEAALTM